MFYLFATCRFEADARARSDRADRLKELARFAGESVELILRDADSQFRRPVGVLRVARQFDGQVDLPPRLVPPLRRGDRQVRVQRANAQAVEILLPAARDLREKTGERLAIDSADPTMMRGKFKIARWFAPKS